MTNRKRFDNLSNAELAKILVKGEWCEGCEGCALKICSTEECVEFVRMWLERKCKDNPSADNEATPPDIVNKPAHYVKGNMECIDFIKAIVSDLTPYEAYCLGNVVKYLWRFKDKNGVIDLDKAVKYIEFLKEAQGNEVET